MKLAKPKTIDEYLASVSPDRRSALEKLRQAIHKVLPGVEECISYAMPAFRYEGHVIGGFLATGKGCSYYPFSGSTLGTLSKELTAYEGTKSALHFDPKRPLPMTVVRKLLATRLAEVRARAAKRPSASTRAKARPRTSSAKKTR